MSKVYKNNVIRSLKDLASYDFQKKAWLASSGPVISSFVEDVCGLYDDTGLIDALKVGRTVFGIKADHALQELHAAIHKINYKRPPQAILEDPLMQSVRDKAAEALKLIYTTA